MGKMNGTSKLLMSILKTLMIIPCALVSISVIADDLVLPPPPPPEMAPVTDGVYAYFDNYYISMVIVSDSSVAITDPGGSDRASRLHTAIKDLTDKPVKKVIYSHDHYDHARGGRIFKEMGAEFISHESCRPLLDNDPLGEVVPPDVTYNSTKFAVELGNKLIELWHFGPSDGRCMSIFYMPREKVMQAVDIHLYGMLVSLDHLYSHEYIGVMNTLQRIRDELDYEFVVNGHMPGSSPQLFDKDLAFVKALYKAVLDGIRKGSSLDELKSNIKLPSIENWQLYKQNLPAHVERMYYAINHGG